MPPAASSRPKIGATSSGREWCENPTETRPSARVRASATRIGAPSSVAAPPARVANSSSAQGS